jgi:hypothetical protein
MPGKRTAAFARPRGPRRTADLVSASPTVIRLTLPRGQVRRADPGKENLAASPLDAKDPARREGNPKPAWTNCHVRKVSRVASKTAARLRALPARGTVPGDWRVTPEAVYQTGYDGKAPATTRRLSRRCAVSLRGRIWVVHAVAAINGFPLPVGRFAAEARWEESAPLPRSQ